MHRYRRQFNASSTRVVVVHVDDGMTGSEEVVAEEEQRLADDNGKRVFTRRAI